MTALKCLTILAAAAGLSSCLLDVKYTVGGTVTGLTGTGLVLAVNSSDNLTVEANGSFIFSSGVAKGDAYTVTVATQPTNTTLANPTEICTVHNGSGTITNVDVGNVLVTCVQAGEYAYVTNETDGTITAYAMNADTGALTTIGSPFSTGGTTPVAAAVDPNGVYLYVVNYATNDVTVFEIDSLTGVPTQSIVTIPTGNAPTAIAIHPSNQYAYVVNSTDDTLIAYTLTNGAATEISGALYTVGVNPQDVKIDPSGNFLYVANYTDGTVSAFTIDYTTGLLTEIGGSPFAAGGSDSGARSIAIDSTGTLAYVANEKSATLSAFAITADTGTLVAVTGTFSTVSSPESIVINPGGNFLYASTATTTSSDIAQFSITPSTGVVTLGATIAGGKLTTPLAIEPLGKYLYAADYDSGTVYAYGLNAGTGALTQIGLPIESGRGPISIAID